MTPTLGLPSSPPPAATRTRVKWENMAILLGGAVVATFAVVIVLMQGAQQSSRASEGPEPAAVADPVLDEAATVPTSELTMTDALGLVEEARQYIAEARWDEASERLASVPTELRDTAGATELAALLETTRTRHEQLRAQAGAAVEARRWKEAATLLTQLAAIAPLDAELQALKATVDRALAPPVAVPAREQAPGRTEPAPSSGAGASRPVSGGGASASRPAAQAAPRPSSSGRPATAPAPVATGGRPAASGAAASPPAALDPLAAIELTPEQEAELAAALGFAAGELK